ncbi:MAG: hypothetical protein DHS20C16_18260 [Phycisphaerae bacterium]|nr:MAG: hypothetical protein DHS20C16_18260 [Phycisphaerae bacterium]
MLSLCAVIALSFIAPDARAISNDLLAVIPQDHLIYFASDDTAGNTSTDSATNPPPLVAIGADMLHRFGGRNVNQSAVSASLDVLASLAKLKPYPFGVVITDAAAKRLGPDSFRLSNLQAALIIETRGDNVLVTRHIQDLLTRWTSRDSARITSKEEYGSKIFTLIDDRLPEWCVVKWGAVKGYYVVSIGHRGFNDAAQSILHADEETFEDTRRKSWQDLLDSQSAHFELQVNFEAIRNALSTVVRGRTQNVLDELGFADCTRSMWTVARKNRAVVCTQLKIVGGIEVLVPISSEALGIQKKLIPDAATEYTLFRCGLDDVLNSATNAYLASRRHEFRNNLKSHWANFEKESGISVQRDILDQLDDVILIHNDPPHPLKLPLLSTIVIPIAGDPATVDKSLAALIDQTNRWMGHANTNASDDTRKFAPRFTKDDDGVWYLSFGFAGPAITVADRFVIISHSPLACRHARDYVLSSVPSKSESSGK